MPSAVGGDLVASLPPSGLRRALGLPAETAITVTANTLGSEW